jgi:hypothetical protein
MARTDNRQHRTPASLTMTQAPVTVAECQYAAFLT